MSDRIAEGKRQTKDWKVTVLLEDDLKDTVERLAAESDRSVSNFVRRVLKEYIDAVSEDATDEDEPD